MSNTSNTLIPDSWVTFYSCTFYSCNELDEIKMSYVNNPSLQWGLLCSGVSVVKQSCSTNGLKLKSRFQQSIKKGYLSTATSFNNVLFIVVSFTMVGVALVKSSTLWAPNTPQPVYPVRTTAMIIPRESNYVDKSCDVRVIDVETPNGLGPLPLGSINASLTEKSLEQQMNQNESDQQNLKPYLFTRWDVKTKGQTAINDSENKQLLTNWVNARFEYVQPKKLTGSFADFECGVGAFVKRDNQNNYIGNLNEILVGRNNYFDPRQTNKTSYVVKNSVFGSYSYDLDKETHKIFMNFLTWTHPTQKKSILIRGGYNQSSENDRFFSFSVEFNFSTAVDLTKLRNITKKSSQPLNHTLANYQNPVNDQTSPFASTHNAVFQLRSESEELTEEPSAEARPASRPARSSWSRPGEFEPAVIGSPSRSDTEEPAHSVFQHNQPVEQRPVSPQNKLNWTVKDFIKNTTSSTKLDKEIDEQKTPQKTSTAVTSAGQKIRNSNDYLRLAALSTVVTFWVANSFNKMAKQEKLSNKVLTGMTIPVVIGGAILTDHYWLTANTMNKSSVDAVAQLKEQAVRTLQKETLKKGINTTNSHIINEMFKGPWEFALISFQLQLVWQILRNGWQKGLVQGTIGLTLYLTYLLSFLFHGIGSILENQNSFFELMKNLDNNSDEDGGSFKTNKPNDPKGPGPKDDDTKLKNQQPDEVQPDIPTGKVSADSIKFQASEKAVAEPKQITVEKRKFLPKLGQAVRPFVKNPFKL